MPSFDPGRGLERVAGVRLNEVRMAVDAVDSIARQLVAQLPAPRVALAELGRIGAAFGAAPERE
ncbi:MAG: hypothetical protein V9G19_25365 [Tetrasphaera sp.]